MDSIIQQLQNLQLDWPHLLKLSSVLLLGCLLISLLGRFIFGKHSALNSAISSAIAIVFICAISVILNSFGIRFQQWLAPLPFVTLQEDTLVLFDFIGAGYSLICSQVLNMVTLAFLINLIDGWLCKSKKFIGWLLCRCVTVVLAYGLHLLVNWLFTAYLPDALMTYAPIVLLTLLLLMILTGALKLVVGALVATVNPIIAALYTFFFANIVGKQITKAMFTTVILAAFVILLRYVGVTVVAIATSALAAYIPFVIILIALWYLINRLL